MSKEIDCRFRFPFPPGATILSAERKVNPMPKPYRLLPPEAFERPARQATRPRISEEEREYYRGLFADIQDQDMPGAEIPLEEGENPKRVKMHAKSVAKELGMAIRFVRMERGSNILKLRRQTDEEIAKNRERGQRLRPRQAQPAEVSPESSGNGAEAPARRRPTS